MEQYIDKSALVAEIKGYISNYKEIVAKINRNDSTWVDSVSMIDAKIDVLQHVLFFLDTLEAKEIGVDLGDPKCDIGVKTVWDSSNSLVISRNGNSRNGDDLEEAAIKYGNCFEKHSDLASMAFIKGAMCGKEQAEIQIKAQSMALPHGCLNKEPVSNDLEEAARKIATRHSHISGDTYYANDAWFFKKGAEWQKENLWHPADGDDLPEIDRDVIALLLNGMVVVAHRPTEYWDCKNILTGEVTRYEAKRYDKGGWNMPDVKWWLDVDLPKMEE